jgi:hypothetical protein
MKKINENFICLNCGEENPPAEKTCRNHCRECLCSLHVDKEVPGDRASNCKGLMKPMGIDIRGNKGIMITHKCEKCGKIIENKAATDDNSDKITEISTYGFAKINKK